jgi:hypothetical protein
MAPRSIYPTSREVREAFDKTAGCDEMREGFNSLHELIGKLTG